MGPLSLLRPGAASLEPYRWGEQPQGEGFVKLNTNESPYPPSPRVLRAIREAAAADLRLYPDPLARRVRERIAKIHGLRPGNVAVGHGSDELLSVLFRAAAGPGRPVAYLRPSYGMYHTLARVHGAPEIAMDYGPRFARPAGFPPARARIALLCNPNSPSGTFVPPREIGRLARRTRGILALDEAYADFSRANALALVRRHPNLVVLRTLSKSFSLAGLRFGYAVGHEELIGALLNVKEPYNMDRIGLAAGLAALNDLPWMRRNVRRIIRARGRLSAGLAGLGFDVLPSEANFVLARAPGGRAREIYEALKARKVLVRWFDLPPIRDSLRITVGSEKEVATLLRELRELQPG